MLNPYLLLALEGLPLDAAPGFLVQGGKADPGWCCFLEKLQMILSPETWLGDPAIPRSGGKDNLLFVNSKSPVLTVVHKGLKPNIELICIHHSHGSLDIINPWEAMRPISNPNT